VFIDDFLYEEFAFSINEDGLGWLQGTVREEVVVVFEEWANLGGVEHWEGIWGIREVEHYCGMSFVSSQYGIWSIKSQHELCHVFAVF